MRIFIKCSFETDAYGIDDFKNGATITVSPVNVNHSVKTHIPLESIDKLSDQITLEGRI